MGEDREKGGVSRAAAYIQRRSRETGMRLALYARHLRASAIKDGPRHKIMEGASVLGGIAVYSFSRQGAGGGAGVAAGAMYEVSEAILDGIPFPRAIIMMVMSNEVWEELPPDIQKVFDDQKEWGTQEIVRGYRAIDDWGKGAAAEANLKVYTYQPEELEVWQVAFEALQEEWVQEQEARGLPGRAFLDEMLRLIAKYS